MTDPQHAKVFLSSTFVDLADLRAKVAQLLSRVYGAELIVMETFGSDAAPPNISSVRRVRECDYFVGIYAHRYGTVDVQTGKSITELELEEAEAGFSSGAVSDILLYLLSDNAPWPRRLKERTPEARAGLNRIKAKAQKHTYSAFRTADQLVESVLRDIFTRLSAHMSAAAPAVRRLKLPPPKRARQPFGMEYLTSESKDYLIGRTQHVKRILEQLDDFPVVLLLGESGVGKTSLIHAGVIPEASSRGWRPVYTRPLGFPSTDVANQAYTSIYTGRATCRGSILPLLGQAVKAIPQRRLLLVVDQFEDVLASRDAKEVDDLILAVKTVRELGIPAVRVLIGYRADLEGRLGEYWQMVSGSPQGLPRVYLSGISAQEAWQGICRVARDLSVRMDLRPAAEKRIARDLLAASQALGFPDVYPPYVQMFLDHVWTAAGGARGTYKLHHYQSAGGIDGVIGGYLGRQLEYARDSKGQVRAVLVSLVRSYGVKAQKPLSEVSSDTGMTTRECETALEKLIDLRLVRHIDEYYEISHDFIAKRIVGELVDAKEHECKRFRELLTSKAAAYGTTKARLTSEELLMLYRHRQRIIPNELELRLLLFSWCHGNGPALYWLLAADPAKVREWVRAEEASADLDREEKVSLVLLRRKLGESPLVEADYRAFRNYQLSAELAGLILEVPASIPADLVLLGLRHRRDEVRAACTETVVAKMKSGDWSWLAKLSRSSSALYRQTYIALILREDVPAPSDLPQGDRVLAEFSLLKRLASAKDGPRAIAALRALRASRPRALAELIGQAICAFKTGRLRQLLQQAERVSQAKAEILLSTVAGNVPGGAFDVLVSFYEAWNSRVQSEETTPVARAKAHALGAAIARTASPQHLPRIRRACKKVRLDSTSRGLIHALLEHGKARDLRLVLDLVGGARHEIDLWNHTELGQTALRQMARVGSGIPKWLIPTLRKQEFDEYIPREERSRKSKRNLLPIRCVENRSLYVRLASYGAIGLAGRRQESILQRLATHSYGMVAAAAAAHLVRLRGLAGLQRLVEGIPERMERGQAESYAGALRVAEMALHGVGHPIATRSESKG